MSSKSDPMKIKVPMNHSKNEVSDNFFKISLKFSLISGMGSFGVLLFVDPLYAMTQAPNAIIPVPDHRLVVKFSPGRSKQLKIELNMSPILCKGDKIISGRVEI